MKKQFKLQTKLVSFCQKCWISNNCILQGFPIDYNVKFCLFCIQTQHWFSWTKLLISSQNVCRIDLLSYRGNLYPSWKIQATVKNKSGLKMKINQRLMSGFNNWHMTSILRYSLDLYEYFFLKKNCWSRL